MSQKQKTPEPEKKPQTDEAKKDSVKKEEDDLDFDELRNDKQKIIKKWNQVGQTGGE